MKLEVTKDAPPDWDALVRAFGGNLFHSTSWASYRALELGRRPLFFHWRTGQHSAAIGLASEASLVRVHDRPVVTTLSFDTVPAMGTTQLDLIPSLRAWAKDARRIVECGLGSADAVARWGPAVPRVFRRYEFLLQPADEAVALKRMRKGTRSAISRARRKGLVAAAADDETSLKAFANVYRSTLIRLAQTKRIRTTEVDIDAFAQRLADLVRNGSGRLFATSIDGQIVGGCFFGVHDGSAYYLYNGAEPTALRDGATPTALLRAIADLSADGCRRLNLGGVPFDAYRPDSPDHGLYSFKLGLGCTGVECESGTLVTASTRHRALRVLRWAQTKRQ